MLSVFRARAALVAAIAAGSLSLATPSVARADTQTQTEERFQDLFVTAGYCTAFGAALGTAFLAFTDNPAGNLQYVAIGASLGFIGGSLLGSYIIFSPMIADEAHPYTGGLASERLLPERGVVIRPTWDKDQGRVKSVEGGFAVASF